MSSFALLAVALCLLLNAPATEARKAKQTYSGTWTEFKGGKTFTYVTVDDLNGSVWGLDSSAALWYSAKGDGSDWESQAMTGVMMEPTNWITARNGVLWLGAGLPPGGPAGRAVYSLAAFGGKFAASTGAPPLESPLSIDKDGTMVGIYLYGTSYYYTPAGSASATPATGNAAATATTMATVVGQTRIAWKYDTGSPLVQVVIDGGVVIGLDGAGAVWYSKSASAPTWVAVGNGGHTFAQVSFANPGIWGVGTNHQTWYNPSYLTANWQGIAGTLAHIDSKGTHVVGLNFNDHFLYSCVTSHTLLMKSHHRHQKHVRGEGQEHGENDAS